MNQSCHVHSPELALADSNELVVSFMLWVFYQATCIVGTCYSSFSWYFDRDQVTCTL